MNLGKEAMTKQQMLHHVVTVFEDAFCYPREEVLKLHGLHSQLRQAEDSARIEALIADMKELLSNLQKVENAPQRIYLWSAGNMPSLGEYTENPESRYNHDPEFQPYMYAFEVAAEVTPKGAVIVCAGGDHGDCTLHEGYQTCVDMNRLGYQAFLLLNRTNHCPYDAKEAGADAARAVRMVRRDAAKYRIDENKVAFAGFSNGGLTAEACVQYFSGTQKVKQHFPAYQPDELDAYYGAPDAIMNVYGPRWKGVPFDYTNAVYPPTFFAVGREDAALDNLNALMPELLEHHVEVEVHTFAGVPHGQSGLEIYGVNPYPHFQLWLPLADAFMQNVFAKSVIKRVPDALEDKSYHFDAFGNGEVLLNKKKNHLPALGWNSWNAFGSGNTEALTKAMADAMVELELDKLGYQYIVLDDGCYRPVREAGRLVNEPVKFPNGFRSLSDYIHAKGLKFGMYNDIGTNLCAGAAVGTCGHEEIDAQTYVDWGVDFIKIDNCYYLFDDATFSDKANAKYTYAPNIRSIRLCDGENEICCNAVKDGVLTGRGALVREDYVTNIGTFDGTGPEHTPVGAVSGELVFEVAVPKDGSYELFVEYATGMMAGTGSWLQIAVSGDGEDMLVYDDFVPATPSSEQFEEKRLLRVDLKAGRTKLRLMNHRRQENTLSSYAAFLEGVQKADPNGDMLLSICEWGKTQPQSWGYKVGDSWRILNDITFRVGADGDPGYGTWEDDYTPSVTSQYNKAVIMDEFAGLDKGWNDPDMLMVGMNGLTETMYRTHFTMWAMMNAPMMLGLDLRRVKKGDAIWQIIANKEVLELNQDTLGIPAKRVYCSLAKEAPETEYIRDNERVDILAKPLADGGLALSFLNLSSKNQSEPVSISLDTVLEKLSGKCVNAEQLAKASAFCVTDLWTKETTQNGRVFSVDKLEPCGNRTIKIKAGE